MKKEFESRIKAILQNAEEFYRFSFEVTGGCDHSVGICECQERQDYENLKKLMKDLEINIKQ